MSAKNIPPAQHTTYRILLADDHMMVLSALKALLAQHPELQVLGEAHDIQTLMGHEWLARADLVVLDLNLPEPAQANRGAELPGLRALPRLRLLTRGKILVLSMHDESLVVLRALQLGAHGFVTKSSPSQRLFDAIAALRMGQTYVDPAILGVRPPTPAGTGAHTVPSTAGADTPALSAQEREVGQLLLAGLAQKSIAHRLGVSPQTVHTYKRRIQVKLGTRTEAELLQRLTQHLDAV